MSISPTRLTIIVIGLGIVAILGKYGSNATPTATPQVPVAAPLPPPVAVVSEPLHELPSIKWGNLDRSYGVLEGDFTLTNTNKFPIKDVILRCDITGGSGTVIRSPTFTVYETVPANGKKTVRKFNFGFWPSQGKSFACNTALK